MGKMHENEFEINEQLAKHLIKTQCPQWIHLQIKRIMSSGTDHALFRLGNDYIIRLPRLAGAKKNIDKECEWLPQIAQEIKTAISLPLYKGIPDDAYSSYWTVNKWNEGHNPNFEKEDEYKWLAKDLANFVNELHKLKLNNGPISRRGVSLKEVDVETRNAIAKPNEEIGTQVIAALWDHFLNITPFKEKPVWVHGDLLPGNILIQENRLSAVIDFSDVGMGDPACDMIIAWSLLNEESRKIFRENLVNMDDNAWQRGKGWALSIALIMLPYYKKSNPVLATLARRIIRTIINSEKR